MNYPNHTVLLLQHYALCQITAYTGMLVDLTTYTVPPIKKLVLFFDWYLFTLCNHTRIFTISAFSRVHAHCIPKN